MGAETGARTLDDGVIFRPIFVSESLKFPLPTSTVQVEYHLVDREGKVLDESITSDETVKFSLQQLIRCWQIAIPKMSKGSFAKISCPSDTAYGDAGTPDGSIVGGAALTFHVMFLDFQ